MAKEIDYDNLTEFDVEYLRQRNWLTQPTNEQLTASGLDVEPESADDTDESNREVVELDPPVVPEETLNTGEDDIILEDPEDSEPDYEGMDKEELRDACLKRNPPLPVSGNKGELIARLEEDDKSG